VMPAPTIAMFGFDISDMFGFVFWDSEDFMESGWRV
jgi:hypothetical protein